MTREDEIRAVLRGITPYPWGFDSGDRYQLVNDNGDYIISAEDYSGCPGLGFREHDADLIAKAPEYIAYLLRENERLREMLAQMEWCKPHRYLGVNTPICPICGSTQWEQHDDDCLLAQALQPNETEGAK